LELFRKDYFKTRKNFLLLFSIMILYVLMAELMVRYNFFNVYIIPFAMLPMVIRIFLDSRTAFISHVIVMIICSIFLRYPYEFLLLQITAGLVGIYSLRELSRRSQLFRSAFLITASYATINFSLDLMHENEISKINLNMYVNFLINGGFLLLTYPLLALFEKGFGFISNVTLVELSDTNNKLLRQLSEEAPGTFQHCINVGNLAAAAADQIGAKNQLIRTGALYHDIGKMKNAVFFTENQNGVNPHKSLSYEQSAQIVISHVNDGLRLAEKHNLPKQIKDFISTHHGKGQAKYFLVSWMNEHPNDKPDLSKFTYPGPNPFTKETALLMMADSVEATSRSLKEYTEENINDIVDKIIDGQMAAGYFKECPITFKDISTVKAVFKEKLRTMYHTRISYPQLKQQSDQEQASESNNSKTK
jgi:putative nucleotidyltransferase with HDIG domain